MPDRTYSLLLVRLRSNKCPLLGKADAGLAEGE